MKEYNDTPETEFRLLKDDWVPNPDEYPDVNHTNRDVSGKAVVPM